LSCAALSTHGKINEKRKKHHCVVGTAGHHCPRDVVCRSTTPRIRPRRPHAGWSEWREREEARHAQHRPPSQSTVDVAAPPSQCAIIVLSPPSTVAVHWIRPTSHGGGGADPIALDPPSTLNGQGTQRPGARVAASRGQELEPRPLAARSLNRRRPPGSSDLGTASCGRELEPMPLRLRARTHIALSEAREVGASRTAPQGRPRLRGPCSPCSPRLGAGRAVVEGPRRASGPAAVEAAATASRSGEGREMGGGRWAAGYTGREGGGGSAGRGGVGG
jgi:hypothetical protein